MLLAAAVHAPPASCRCCRASHQWLKDLDSSFLVSTLLLVGLLEGINFKHSCSWIQPISLEQAQKYHRTWFWNLRQPLRICLCNLLQQSTVLNLYRIWVLFSLTQNGHATWMACPIVKRSSHLILGLPDLNSGLVNSPFQQPMKNLCGFSIRLKKQVWAEAGFRHLTERRAFHG